MQSVFFFLSYTLFEFINKKPQTVFFFLVKQYHEIFFQYNKWLIRFHHRFFFINTSFFFPTLFLSSSEIWFKIVSHTQLLKTFLLDSLSVFTEGRKAYSRRWAVPQKYQKSPGLSKAGISGLIFNDFGKLILVEKVNFQLFTQQFLSHSLLIQV